VPLTEHRCEGTPLLFSAPGGRGLLVNEARKKEGPEMGKYNVCSLRKTDEQSVYEALRATYGDHLHASVEQIGNRIDSRLNMSPFTWIKVEDANTGNCVAVASISSERDRAYDVRVRLFDGETLTVELGQEINDYIRKNLKAEYSVGYVVFGNVSEGWF